jgi:hypothetical protein
MAVIVQLNLLPNKVGHSALHQLVKLFRVVGAGDGLGWRAAAAALRAAALSWSTVISFYAIMKRMQWTVETLNETVNKELEALPSDVRARFVRVLI